MLPFKKILFPVDYSKSCDAIVPFVRDTVRHLHAELTLVHAYGPMGPGYPDLLFPLADWAERSQKFEQDQLKAFAADSFRRQHVEIRVENGSAGSAIHNIAKHDGIDLVMMPTRGQGVIRRFLMGSTTSQVLHDVSAAVWTGSDEALANHGRPCKSIVCAVDETPEAEVILRAGANLAKSYDAELSLIHVARIPFSAYDVDVFTFQAEIAAAADKALQRLKVRVGIDVPHSVATAFTLEPVHTEIANRKADLLVVGRGHWQNTFGRFWSELYPVIRDATCPVLSI